MRQGLFVSVLIGVLAAASVANAQTPPPAPAQVEPAAGAALVQPITLRWNPVVDPDGPIGSYTWQVATSSSFTTMVLSGFTQQSLPGIPVPIRGPRQRASTRHLLLARQGVADRRRRDRLDRLRLVDGAQFHGVGARLRAGYAKLHVAGQWSAISRGRVLYDHVDAGPGCPVLHARSR